MKYKNLNKAFLILAIIVIADMNLFCQVSGESAVTTVIIKKTDQLRAAESASERINERDTLPPGISLISPQTDTSFKAVISAPDFYLIGRLTDESGIDSLLINDEYLGLDEKGFFQKKYILTEGLNVFEIRASDRMSNSITRYLSIINTSDNIVRNPEKELLEFGKNHALIIGIDKYTDQELIDLDNPISDATLLYSTLVGNYMFEPEDVIFLKNPTRAEIIEELDNLSNILSFSDNLIIFYAGHGFWDKGKETGFWIPSDGDNKSTVNWIRNSTIQDYIDDIATRHTLLITDACFAGSIFKSRGVDDILSTAIEKLFSLSSRKAMTSGTLEEVPDRSVFLEFLIKRLLENGNKYLSASELFNSFREAVLNNSPNVPQYGVIQNTGDEGGDFIFIRR